MSVLHIEDIKARFNIGYYSSAFHCNVTKPIKLSENYIFDEELSVRRNREMVAEHNEMVEQFKAAQKLKQAELDRQLTEDVVAYIKEYYDLTEAQARLVEMWVYKEKHAFMNDYFASIDTFAEFADDIVNLKGEC